MKTSPKAIDKIYECALLNVSDEHIPKVMKLLRWLCFCTRPMRLEELDHVVAVDLERPGYDPEARYEEPRDLLGVYSPLFKTAELYPKGWSLLVHTEIVQLCHPSLREYLVSDRLREGSLSRFHMEDASANALIAKTCLVYILPSCSPDNIGAHARSDVPLLLEYAAKEWPSHYRKVLGLPEQGELDQLAYRLMSEKEGFDVWLQCAGMAEQSALPPAPIYYMSRAGISGVVSMLLAQGVFPDASPGGMYGTALGAACYAGHEDVAQILLERGANVQTATAGGTTPLDWAAKAGHEAIVRLLLDKGADANWSGNALHWAAGAGNENIVQSLLDAGADPNAVREGDEYPLNIAVGADNPEIVRMLLLRGADPNKGVTRSGSPLDLALRRNLTVIEGLLREYGARCHGIAPNVD